MLYLYETHLHTCQASACGISTGAEHVRYYRSIGFTGIFVTDHFFRGNCAVRRDLPWKTRIRQFCSGFEDAWNEGQKCGLDVFFAWEETFLGDDYLIYGLSPEWLMDHPEAEHWTYREQFEAVHAAGGCVVQAHPYRCASYISIITLNLPYADAVEVANAGNRRGWDAAAKKYADKHGLFQVCGSDNHYSFPGAWEEDRIFGMALPEKISSAGDYARMILERRPMRLYGIPEDRFDAGRDPITRKVFRLDADERRIPVRPAKEAAGG